MHIHTLAQTFPTESHGPNHNYFWVFIELLQAIIKINGNKRPSNWRRNKERKKTVRVRKKFAFPRRTLRQSCKSNKKKKALSCCSGNKTTKQIILASKTIWGILKYNFWFGKPFFCFISSVRPFVHLLHLWRPFTQNVFFFFVTAFVSFGHCSSLRLANRICCSGKTLPVHVGLVAMREKLMKYKML